MSQIVLPDVFDPQNANVFDTALEETILGSLSFNGQRCTALKLMFVPTAHASIFAHKFAERVDSLTVGLPWQTSDDGSYSKITPLPNQKRVEYMQSLIEDATSKGAKIINKDGGSVIGGPDSTLMVPAVLYPVTPEMNVYTEEQFGPVIPIAPYDNIEMVLEYGREGIYGQQVSIFTAEQNAGIAADLLDKFAPVFGKININSQCGRSPDTVPFSGRRSSAMGVMSVKDALREFSIPTVVAYKEKGPNSGIVREIEKSSRFMEAL
jgi:glyceraldehyde-3-phosphate dehydrogenase (NADP+)